jgi:hypothetical protein
VNFQPVTVLEITGETVGFLAVGLLVCFWQVLPGTAAVVRIFSGWSWRHETATACSILLFWFAVAKAASSAAQTFIYFRF